METRDIIRKAILPPLRKSISIENKNISSNRSSFGLGLSIAEKKKEQDERESDRFLVDFRLPHVLRSRMQERKFQTFFDESIFLSSSTSSSSKQFCNPIIKNAIQIQCSEADAVSRIPKEIRNIFADNSNINNNPIDEISSHFNFLQQLKHIDMDSLAVDPAPLFASLGIEKPFGTPSKRSTFSEKKHARLIGHSEMSNLFLTEQNGGKGNKNDLIKTNSENQNGSGDNNNINNNQLVLHQRDDESLALPSSSPASELAPWRLRGQNFAQYRRSMYTIGTDSIFSVGNVSRPIRVAALNFLSFQADAVLEKYFYGHLYDYNQNGNKNVPSSIFAHTQFLTDDDAEEAWFHAMHNSKRAVEACSTLLHDRSLIVMSLLRRKRNVGEKFAVMNGASPTQAGTMQHINGSAKSKNEYGSTDRELDTFVRSLRSGFGCVEVLPMKRAPRKHNNFEQQNHSSSSSSLPLLNFEPVIVVCSNEGGGASSRGVVSSYRLDSLPGNDRARLGELVGGGNQARLDDHYRTGGEYVDWKKPNSTSKDKKNDNTLKVKFHINRFIMGYNQSHSAKYFVKTLKPEKLLSNLNKSGSVMSSDRTRTQVHAEKNKKVAGIYRDFTTPKTSSGTRLD